MKFLLVWVINRQTCYLLIRWKCLYLGAGEEKAVFCVCDHEHQIFAVEVIDERHYLNGRFVGGKYYFNKRIPALENVKANPDSEFGLTFTGLIKVREFVYGYEWGRFQFDPRCRSLVDPVLTSFLQTLFSGQFRQYHAHYRDVHDRNVMFEIRPFDQAGVPMLVRTWSSKLALVKVGLQPIDVR
jgi:hypothetical protein